MTNISLDVLKGARDMRLRGQLADLYDGYTASVPAPDPDPPPQPMQPQASAYDEMLTPFQDLVAKNSPQGAPASPVVNNDPYDAMLEPFRANVKPSPYAGALTTLGGTDESEALTQPGGAAYVAGSRPSAAAGAPLAAMSGAYDQSHQGKLVRIGQVARATGLDDEGARILQAVATTEGGLGGAIGDQGQSRGPYQFYEGGQMPAFRSWLKAQGIQGDPNVLVNDVDLATRFAASTYLGDAIRRGRAKGLSGDKLATYVQETGQVSVDPWKTGDNYRALFGGGKDPFAVQPTPAQQSAPPSYQPNAPVRGDTITEETVPTISQVEPGARSGATEGAYVPGGLGRPVGFNTSAYGRLDSMLSQQPVNDQSPAPLEPGDFQIPGYNVSGDVPPDDGATSFATEPSTDAAADSLSGVPDVQVESPPQDPWARVGNAIRDALGFGEKPDLSHGAADIQQRQATMPGTPEADALAAQPMPISMDATEALAAAPQTVPSLAPVQRREFTPRVAEFGPPVRDQYYNEPQVQQDVLQPRMGPDTSALTGTEIQVQADENAQRAFPMPEDLARGAGRVAESFTPKGDEIARVSRGEAVNPFAYGSTLGYGVAEALPSEVKQARVGPITGRDVAASVLDPSVIAGGPFDLLGLGAGAAIAGGLKQVGKSGVFRSTAQTALEDADKILAARMKVAKGAPGAPVYNPEVGETFNLGRYLKNPTAISDRREGIQAVEGYIEKLTGQPALFGDSLWARTRVYEGRADAALAKLDHDVGPSLQQYRKAGGNLTELDVFLEQMDNTDKGMWIAKREGMPLSAVQRQRLFPGGATLQSEQAIRDAWTQRLGPAKSQALFDAADAVWSFTDGLAERLYRSGVIDQQTRLDWQANFPHYVRANILHAMDDANVNNLAPGGRLFGTASDGYKRLTQEGTSRMRQSPLATVIDMAAAAETRAQRNEIAQRVAAWADIPGMQGFVRRLGKDADPPEGWVAMNYLNDGKAERIAIVKQLEPSLTLGAEPHGLVATLVAGMAAPLKKGATALRPSFVVMNGINDALWFLYRAGIESPNPLEAIRAMTDLARGYRVAVGSTASGHAVGMAAGAIAANQTAPEDTSVGDRFIRAGLGGLAGLAGAKALGKIGGQADKDLLYRYRTSGASIYTGTRWDGRPELIAQELAGGRVWVRTIRNEADFKTLAKDTLGAVGDTLGLAYSRPIEAVGAPIELAPRLAAFARAERQGKTQLDAALASRRATVDFAAGGRLIKAANLAIPFLNPALQASLEFAQLSRQHPAKTAAAMATIAGAVIANEAYNRSVAPDDYQDVDKYIRDSGIVIMSDQEPEEGQKRGFAYIPLRGGIGAIVPMVRDAVARFYGDDPRPWQEIAKHVIGSVTPIPGDLSAGLSSLLPPVPALAYELQSNYDTFRDQPIIPRSLEGLPAQEQYTDRTSLTARALSESNAPGMGGKPPAAIEYGVRNFSPGPGEIFLGLGDMILQATGAAPEGRSFAEREKTARDVPVTGGIIGRFSRVTGEARKAQAYDAAGKIVEDNQRMVLDIVRNWPEYANATPDRQKQIMATANRYLSEYAQEVAGVETKPKDLGAPQRWLGVDPGSEYEREIVKAIGADTRDATPRQRMLAARYRGSETTQYKLWADRKEKSSDKLKDAVRSSVEH